MGLQDKPNDKYKTLRSLFPSWIFNWWKAPFCLAGLWSKALWPPCCSNTLNSWKNKKHHLCFSWSETDKSPLCLYLQLFMPLQLSSSRLDKTFLQLKGVAAVALGASRDFVLGFHCLMAGEGWLPARQHVAKLPEALQWAEAVLLNEQWLGHIHPCFLNPKSGLRAPFSLVLATLTGSWLKQFCFCRFYSGAWVSTLSKLP